MRTKLFAAILIISMVGLIQLSYLAIHRNTEVKSGPAGISKNQSLLPCVFSWSLPYFGRYGNQLIMDLTAFLLANDLHCQFISPPLLLNSLPTTDAVKLFRDQTFRYRFDHQLLASYNNNKTVDIYSKIQELIDQDRFVSPYQSIDEYPVESVQLITVKTATNRKITIRIFAFVSDELWTWGSYRTRIGLWSGMDSAMNAATRLIDSSPELMRLAKLVLLQSSSYARIPHAVGVHLRGGDFVKACQGFLNRLISLIYACYMDDATMIIAEIEAVRRIQDNQPVFIASQFAPDSPLIKELQRFYGDLFINDQFNLSSSLTGIEWTDENELRSILSHQLLTGCDWFIGNFHSSFTNTIVLRRRYWQYTYLNSRVFWPFKNLTLLYSGWIMVVLLVASKLIHYGRGLRSSCAIIVWLIGITGLILIPVFMVQSGFLASLIVMVAELLRSPALWIAMRWIGLAILTSVIISLLIYFRDQRNTR